MNIHLRYFSYLFAIVLIFAACSNMFNEDDNGPELNLQTTQSPSETTTFNGDTLVFKRFEEGGIPQEYPPFASDATGSQVIINGYYLALSGFRPAGEINQENNVITILIEKDKRDGTFPTQPTGYFYNAYIRNLESGNYTVKIVHRDDLMRAPDQEEHTLFTKEFVIE